MTSAVATIFPEDDRPHLAGWIAAALVVVAAHVILAIVILYARDEAPAGSEAPPAVMIDLAPLAVAPPAEQQLDVPEAPEKMEEAPPEEVKPPTPDMTQPVEPLPEPPPVEQPAVVVPQAPLAPKPEVVLAPPPKPAPKVEKKVEKPVVKHDHKPPAERTAAPKRIDAAPSRNAASPQSQTGAPTMSSSSWQSMVSARLNSVKHCPAGASGSGTATVSFTITGSGGVGGARLAGSSGNSALDQEAVGMVHRASPYPPTPSGGPVSLSVPIHFGC